MTAWRRRRGSPRIGPADWIRDRRELERLQIDGEFARIEPRGFQQIVDERGKPVGAVLELHERL
jgi:hypothetical protein